MLVFTDILTGDDMFSDAFKFTEVDNVVYEVKAQEQLVGATNVDIGANPSAEETEETPQDGARIVVDVVESGALTQPEFLKSLDKKGFLGFIKDYMKKIKAELQKSDPDQVAVFEKGAQEYVKKILPKIKDFEFYLGKSEDPDGMIALLNRADPNNAYMVFWKHGLKETKV